MSEKEFLVSVGKKIKEARTNKNLKQTDLATICRVEKASLSRLESGKGNPTVLTLLKISRALDTPVAFFFFEDGSPRSVKRTKSSGS